MDFLAVRAEVATEALGVASVSVGAAFVVRVDPRFDSRVFEHPAECCWADDDVIAGDAESGGPFIAPPAIVEHACRGFHVVPQELCVEFPIRERFNAQVECKRDIVLIALQVFLENVRDEWDDVCPFEFAAGAIAIGVRVGTCGFDGCAVK